MSRRTRQRSLTGRVFRMICISSLTVLIVSTALVVNNLYSHFTKVHYDDLEYRTRTIAFGVEKYGVSFLEGSEPGSYNITWVSATGEVLFDTFDDSIDTDERSFHRSAPRGLR